jgi:hypothetical protein
MSEQLSSSVTYIPAQPAMLALGERRIAIDEWPLARSVEEGLSVELSRPTEDVLVIEPKKRATAGMFAKTVFLILGAWVPVLIAATFEGPWWLILLGGTMAGLCLVLLVHSQLSRRRWIRFDRKEGQFLIERRTGFGQNRRVESTYPLGVVQAIQLLYNGRHSVSEPQGTGEQQTVNYREFFGYELNLVLDNPEHPRMNLLSFSDWQWLRESGHRLATFLNVPIIDKLHHGA